MTDALIWPEPTATLSRIGQVAGVGRAAVANWRRLSPDFPQPVGGTDTSPEFAPADAELWLHQHGKIAHYEPGTPTEPAILTLPDGTAVVLVDPKLRRQDGLVRLDGFATRNAWVPLERAVFHRVQVPGLPDVAVTSASADISNNGPSRHITLLWREDNEHTLTDS
ncbi:hypothetical protein [Kitasatospora sp. NPDC088548]|uniref:hypothetical protein n=1 Tax=Kitasatospora sp. NPDC088548 TaxID=3364075 RepID=UPI00380A4E1B